MKFQFRPFEEQKYKKIISAIGPNRYELFSKDEPLPGDLPYRIRGRQEYSYSLVGTGATIANYTFMELEEPRFTIPKGSQLFVCRMFALDETHGFSHYNAYDQIIFPTLGGNIFSFARNNAPDHYIALSELGGLATISEAYKLPVAKTGTVNEYQARGASIHIEPMPFIDR